MIYLLIPFHRKIMNKDKIQLDPTQLLPEFNETLSGLTESEKQQMMQQCINLGYRVLQLTKIEVIGIDKPLEKISNTISTQMDRISQLVDKSLELNYNHFKSDVNTYHSQLNTYQDKLTKMTNSFNELSHNIHCSSTKGKIGENMLQNSLIKYFPECLVIDTSKIANQADIHFNFPHQEPIWIEIKTYSKPVPTTEVVKFQKEMQDNKIPFGIFVSTTGITKHHRIELEELSYGGKLLYLPNVDQEYKLVLLGLQMFKHLSSRYGSSEDVTVDKNQRISELVIGEMEHLVHLGTFYTDMKKRLEKSLKKMMKELQSSSDDLTTQLGNLESEYLRVVNRLDGMLSLVDRS